MKIKLIFIFSCLVISFSIFSQEQENTPQNTEQSESILKKPNENVADSIKNREDLADKILFELNGELKKYSSLLKTKIDVLPYRIVFYKGKSDNDKCAFVEDQNQTDLNCLRLETYDFTLNTNKASSFKAATKFIELHFSQEALQNNNESSPDLNKIVTNIYVMDFSKNSTFLSEVIDNAPTSTPNHDDKILLYSQRDGFPEKKMKNKKQSGLGLVSLSDIGNRDLSLIRLDIKWDFYRKNLMYFEQTLTKIKAFNSDNIDKNYLNNLKNLQESLDF